MIQILEKNVPSSDGIHTLMGKVYLPEGEPKAFFHLVHGMTEHIGRYDAFLTRMAEEGYLAFAYDHLGHGKTGDADHSLGFIAHRDGWRTLVRDVAVFARAVREEYGAKPYYLLGHSMGSFVVRLVTTLEEAPEKLVVMGTGGPNPAAGAGILLAKCIAGIKGERSVSPFLEKLTFGSYNSRFGEDGGAWLTKDKAVREFYRQDRFCTFHFTVSAMADLMTLTKNCNAASWFRSVPKGMPLLLVSGTQDPVGDYGKGVEKVYENLVKNGCLVEKHFYENCRHEILNDSCREDVIRDILAFLTA